MGLLLSHLMRDEIEQASTIAFGALEVIADAQMSSETTATRFSSFPSPPLPNTREKAATLQLAATRFLLQLWSVQRAAQYLTGEAEHAESNQQGLRETGVA